MNTNTKFKQTETLLDDACSPVEQCNPPTHKIDAYFQLPTGSYLLGKKIESVYLHTADLHEPTFCPNDHMADLSLSL